MFSPYKVLTELRLVNHFSDEQSKWKLDIILAGIHLPIATKPFLTFPVNKTSIRCKAKYSSIKLCNMPFISIQFKTTSLYCNAQNDKILS